MKSRALLALTVVAAVAVAATPVAFGGAGAKIDLTIRTVSETNSQYKGKIKSDDPICVADRLIKVKSHNSRLVKTRSDEDGKFDENGRRPESGAQLKLKVVETDDCEPLIETTTAE